MGFPRVSYLESERFPPAPADEPEDQPGQHDDAHADDEEVLRLPRPHPDHLQRLKLAQHKRQSLVSVLLAGSGGGGGGGGEEGWWIHCTPKLDSNRV